jgi:plastocyanin
MRKLFALTGAAIAATALAGGVAFAGAPSKTKPPVTLEGKVANKGEKSVKSGKISIEADDFYFKPTFPKAKLGSKVSARLKNEGKTQHTFTIPSLGIDTVLDEGKSATVQLTLPTDGALAFYCRFHGAPPSGGQGMQGAFFSKKGEALSTGGGAASATATSAPTATTGAAPTTAPAGGGYGY